MDTCSKSGSYSHSFLPLDTNCCSKGVAVFHTNLPGRCSAKSPSLCSNNSPSLSNCCCENCPCKFWIGFNSCCSDCASSANALTGNTKAKIANNLLINFIVISNSGDEISIAKTTEPQLNRAQLGDLRRPARHQNIALTIITHRTDQSRRLHSLN